MTSKALHFNLVKDPWIQVIHENGTLQTVSLIELIDKGPLFRALVGDIPTQALAILRLVLAILHRALADERSGTSGPRDIDHWSELVDDWSIVCEPARQYLTSRTMHFDLFHNEIPFFQVADLRTSKDEVSGLEKIIADIPNGHPFLTTRMGRGVERLTPSEAARWLVHCHAFDASGIRSGAVGDPRVKNGKGYPIGPGWLGQLGGIHLVGRTVAQTLLLNLIAFEAIGFDIRSDDLPPWDRPPQGSGEDSGGREPRGPVDLYTWQSRRVRLVHDGEDVVGVVLSQGDHIEPSNRHRLEPMTAWRYSKPQSQKRKADIYLPLTHDAERSFWRGLSALLPSATRSGPGGQPSAYLSPGLIRWANRLAYEETALSSGGPARVRAVGMQYGAQRAVVEEMIDDELELPWTLFDGDQDDLANIVLDALERTENATSAYASLAVSLAEAVGADPMEVGARRDAARSAAYAALDLPFRAWLSGLAGELPLTVQTLCWSKSAHRVLATAGLRLLEEVGPAAWIGRNVNGMHIDAARADIWFRTALAKFLPMTEGIEKGETQ